MMALSYRVLADLVGRTGMCDVACPVCGPGRRHPANRKRRVLRIWHKERGFATYACARCGSKGFAHEDGPRCCPRTAEARPAGTILSLEINDDAKLRTAFAMQSWHETIPIKGTLGWRYFTERRGLHIGALCSITRSAGTTALVPSLP
jgi:hypothetical protein